MKMVKLNIFVTRNPDDFKKISKNLTNLNVLDVEEINLEEDLKKEGYFEI